MMMLQADKATIVGEAVTYIRTLEGTLQKLEKMKLERKRALAAQQHGQQQQLMVGAGSSSRASSARHPASALPAPAPASSREANLADMVHSLAQQAAVAAANKALAVAAAAAGAGAGGSGSSSSGAAANAQLPRGAVPFPAPAAGFQTWSGQNVVVSVANNEAYINLHCPREPGTLTKALFVLERHSIEVVTTTISAQDGFRMYGIHARVSHQTNIITSWVPSSFSCRSSFYLSIIYSWDLTIFCLRRGRWTCRPIRLRPRLAFQRICVLKTGSSWRCRRWCSSSTSDLRPTRSCPCSPMQQIALLLGLGVELAMLCYAAAVVLVSC